MVTQQVLSTPARSGMFIVYEAEPQALGADEAATVIREVLADLPGLTRGVAFRAPDDHLNCVVGVGANLWDRLYDAPRPAGLHPFERIEGAKHTAVATAGDVLLHLRARRMDLCFELARQVTTRLSGAARIVDEVHGFKFFDERDLLGFVDGTENPEGDDAVAAIRVGEEDPAYAGSSYVIVQKYLHDMTAWNALSVEEQEKVIGRTKLEDIELSEEEKPSNSHVALNTVTDAEGQQKQILRENLPFGTLGEQEFGTYFIGYSADPAVTEEMLHNMFVGKPEGNYDRILDFSTAVTGSLYFVPSAELLEDLPAAEPTEATNPAEEPPTAENPEDSLSVGDGSLGIGSLKHRV